MTEQKDNLSTKVVKGSSWLFSFQFLDNVLAFIRLLVLAKLLTPHDFGLIGIATLVLQILSTFTQTGVQAVLVQHKESEKYLNTGWSYLMIRGIVLYILVFLSAPYLATFFHSVEATSIIRLVALQLVFEGFINIGVIYFQKTLTFSKQFWYQITGNIVDAVVAISLALIFKNVWAIVAGYVSNSFVRMCLSYYLSKYRPKFELDWKLIKEMNNYGKWILGSTILTFLFTQGDDLLVGRLLGTAALGFYQLAYRISNLPATQISFIISTVMFPAYAMLQDNKQKLSQAYISTFKVTAFLSFFMGSIIIAFAHDFTILFIGEQWIPMVAVMQVLTAWGMLRSIGATTGALWQAVGTPNKITRIQLIQTIIMAILIYPLTMKLGYTGTGIAVVLAAIVGNAIAVMQIARTVGTRIRYLALELLFPVLGAISVFAIFYALKLLIPPATILNFIILAVSCAGTYLLITVAFSKLKMYTVFTDLFRLIRNFPAAKKYANLLQKLESIAT